MSTAAKIMVHMANIANTVQANREISAALSLQLQTDTAWIKAQQKQVTEFAKTRKTQKSNI